MAVIPAIHKAAAMTLLMANGYSVWRKEGDDVGNNTSILVPSICQSLCVFSDPDCGLRHWIHALTLELAFALNPVFQTPGSRPLPCLYFVLALWTAPAL